MQHKKDITHYKNKKFVKEEDEPDVGLYLYVFDMVKCIKDYLQDTLEIAKDCAFDDYGVFIDSWEEIK